MRDRDHSGAHETKGYQSNLNDALGDFEKRYSRVLSEVGTVSQTITDLKSKISSLQDNIAENNAAVLDTFLDTAGSEIEQGVAVAEENVADVFKAGVQMGVTYLKGLAKVIELNEKTQQDLLAIRKLGKQIGKDEVIHLV